MANGIVELTTATFDETIAASDRPVIVDFWAEWCGPCRAMSPYVDKLAEEFEGKLKVVKLNTQDNNEVPARYGVNSIPTFLLIKNGEVAHQIVGSKPYDKFKAEITAHL